MKDIFADLLKELSEIFDTDLQVDVHHACTLLFDKKLPVQIQLDKTETMILVGSFLCPLPPGKFREMVLFSALKENYKIPPIATFAYTDKNNQLTLFRYLPIEGLSSKKLAEFLAAFYELAILWKTEIERGNANVVALAIPSNKPSIFEIPKP
ncbi:MAG: CesT family type III secretion system chaperone [Chlamydiota bacterium]